MKTCKLRVSAAVDCCLCVRDCGWFCVRSAFAESGNRAERSEVNAEGRNGGIVNGGCMVAKWWTRRGTRSYLKTQENVY
jgi:hypothetical protein